MTRTPTLKLDTRVTPAAQRAFWPILDTTRNLGIGICGTRGIGKSQLLRLIAWLDFVQHQVPVFLIDPVGATTDALLAHICRFRAEDQAKLWPRILYVDLDPTERVVPVPIYYRTGIGTEDLSTIAQRLPDTLGMLDPKLRDASVEGFNSLYELSTKGGQILAALGSQPCELRPLLEDDPSTWTRRFRDALHAHPEIFPAIDFFTNRYFPLSPGAKQQRTRSLVQKLGLFESEAGRAQFCSDHPGLDWQAILRERKLVIFDIRAEQPFEIKQLKMTWVLMVLLDFLRRFGATQAGDRSMPISLIIDEMSVLFPSGTRRSPLTSQLDRFIQVQSRNFNVWFTCAYQEFYQLPPGSRQTMLSLGTQFFGRVTDKESLEVIRHRAHIYGCQIPALLDPLTGETEVTLPYLAQLPLFTYLVSQTVEEGAPPRPLRTYTIKPFVPRQRPAKALVAGVRRDLTTRDGLPMRAILTELEKRKQAPSPEFVLADSSPLTPRFTPPPTGFDDDDV